MARLSSLLPVCLWLASAGAVGTASAAPDPSAVLRDKHAAVATQLRQNEFRQPLVVESTETPNRLTGDIYAELPHPFAQVRSALKDADDWCDVVSLHINTKYCQARQQGSGTTLRMHIGKKTPEALSDAPRVDFTYRTLPPAPDYFAVALDAQEGPMGTSDYRIRFEAVELSKDRTFVHLSYSYAYGFAGRLALQGYLATLGSGKVGFTAADTRAGAPAGYIGGLRGLVERNAMRYYLAVAAFMDAESAAPAARFEQRLAYWFDAVERYPRQLHEMDRDAYLEMKRAENQRQHAQR